MKRKLLIPLFSLATLVLTSCGGGNETSSTGTPVVAQATIAQIVTACEASSSYGGTGPLLTNITVPTIYQCTDALPGIAWGDPWTVYLYGGCASSSSFDGPNAPLNNNQINACTGALYVASTPQECEQGLGGIWTPKVGTLGGVRAFVFVCEIQRFKN